MSTIIDSHNIDVLDHILPIEKIIHYYKKVILKKKPIFDNIMYMKKQNPNSLFIVGGVSTYKMLTQMFLIRALL